ncbi:unnamed protein product, partial [marine sediment metagenome]
IQPIAACPEGNELINIKPKMSYKMEFTGKKK